MKSFIIKTKRFIFKQKIGKSSQKNLLSITQKNNSSPNFYNFFLKNHNKYYEIRRP